MARPLQRVPKLLGSTERNKGQRQGEAGTNNKQVHSSIAESSENYVRKIMCCKAVDVAP